MIVLTQGCVATLVGLAVAAMIALLLAMYGAAPAEVSDYHVSVEPPRVGALHRGVGLRLERLNGLVETPGNPEAEKQVLDALRMYKAGLPTRRTSQLEPGAADPPPWTHMPPPDPMQHPGFMKDEPWRVWGAGWPFVALRCATPEDFPIPMPLLVTGHRIYKEPSWVGTKSRALERTELAGLRPWWPGLLLDGLMNGAATWLLLFVGVRRGVRLLRRRRGRCPICGYELSRGRLSACPECGWGKQ